MHYSVAMERNWKRGTDIEVGDSIEFLGQWHRVARIDDASAATKAIVGPDARRAIAADGWSITIDGERWTVA